MTAVMRRALGGAALLTVVVAVAAGLVLSGSPAAARARRLDARRVEDLVRISNAIDLYYVRQHTLPVKLTGLGPPSGPSLSVRDPVTSETYEYRTVAARRYELCAAFTAPSDEAHYEPEFWKHGSGRQCFQLDVRDVPR
jgi:hypothetical protein